MRFYGFIWTYIFVAALYYLNVLLYYVMLFYCAFIIIMN